MHERIAHIMWQLGIGGAERALFQLVREQRRNGISADVIVGKDAGYYGDRTREIGAMVHELGQSRGSDISVGPRFRELLADYDIVHFHSAEISLFQIASRVPNIRRYYTHRSGVFEYPFQQKIRYRIAGAQLRRYFDGISGNTNQASEAAAQLFGIPAERIATTYNGIDFSLLDPKRSANEVYYELGGAHEGKVAIGTSANLRDWKRIHLLLEAVALMPNEPIHCYIIGDGPARVPLQELARELGITTRVTFTGMKEHVGDYLQLLDIFVLPSGPEESFGNSVVEAMGVGLPSLVFADGGGMVEHIDHTDTGYIVDDVDDLVDHLRMLIGDSDLRQEIGSAARTHIREKYALDGLVGRYKRLYGTEQGKLIINNY